MLIGRQLATYAVNQGTDNVSEIRCTCLPRHRESRPGATLSRSTAPGESTSQRVESQCTAAQHLKPDYILLTSVDLYATRQDARTPVLDVQISPGISTRSEPRHFTWNTLLQPLARFTMVTSRVRHNLCVLQNWGRRELWGAGKCYKKHGPHHPPCCRYVSSAGVQARPSPLSICSSLLSPQHPSRCCPSLASRASQPWQQPSYCASHPVK